MTAKEQARLQVLNSLLTEHMILNRAPTLIGVNIRDTRRILVAYQRTVWPPMPTVIAAAAELPTNRLRWPRRIDVRQILRRLSGTKRSQEPGYGIAQSR